MWPRQRAIIACEFGAAVAAAAMAAGPLDSLTRHLVAVAGAVVAVPVVLVKKSLH